MSNPQSSPDSVSRVPMRVGARGVEITSIEDLQRASNLIVASGYAPKGDTPQGVAVKIQLGLELGLPPMFALSSIKVLNGRPSIFGDAGKSLLLASGMLDGAPEVRVTGKPDDFEVIVKMRRKGMPGEFVGTFSTQDAKRAKLWGKAGPWTDYPVRQATWRAWWFAAREGFADVLGGIGAAEEVLDTTPRDVEVEPSAPQARPRGLDGLVARMPAPEAPTPTVEPASPHGQEEGAAEADLPTPEPDDQGEAPPVWFFDPETPLDVSLPVRCGVWADWCDIEVPKGKLHERAKTWREAAQGKKGGGRHALLLDIVKKAQKLPPSERVQAHERAACTLAVLVRGMGSQQAATPATSSEELPWQ